MVKTDFITLLNSKRAYIQEIMISQFREVKAFIEKNQPEFRIIELPSISKEEFSVGSLDGGMRKIDLASAFISLTRAAGNTWPGNHEWIEKLDLDVYPSPQNIDNYIYLNMALLETAVAREIIKQRNPTVLILDGSIESLLTVGLPNTLLYSLPQSLDTSADESNPIIRHLRLFNEYIQSVWKLIYESVKSDTLLLGASKDSRARILLPPELKKTTNITDVGYVGVQMSGVKGFSEPVEYRIKIQPRILEYIKKVIPTNDVFSPTDLRLVTSYVKLHERALPIRLDLLPDQVHRMEEAISILRAVDDGKGFPIPPQLAHEKAHITNDFANLVERFCLETVKEIDLDYYYYLYSPSRRSRIQ